jgi:acetate---CoA ligase (ADP-forming)
VLGRRRGLHLLAGLELGLTAVGHALRWQERRARGLAGPPARPSRPRQEWPERFSGAWPETAGRRLMALTGVPMVPAELARSAEEAVAATGRTGYPAALKVCGAGLAHKSDVGGVALHLTTPTAVRRAYSQVRRAAAGLPGTAVEGVLVSPMRGDGVELLAGVTVDPMFGPVLAVGLGGIWVEVLRDVALRVLPIDRADARDMLGELRAAPVLRGARGGTPVDVERVADVLLRLTEAAALVGPRLQALEVNPLWCQGERIEGLDVLVVTAAEEA